MAFTSGDSRGDTDDRQYVRLNVNGDVRTRRLYNTPGGDYVNNRGTQWKIHIENTFGYHCVQLQQIKSISIIAGGDDGWQVSSIATYVSYDNYGRNSRLLSLNLDAYRWLDTDKSTQKEFKLHIQRC